MLLFSECLVNHLDFFSEVMIQIVRILNILNEIDSNESDIDEPATDSDDEEFLPTEVGVQDYDSDHVHHEKSDTSESETSTIKDVQVKNT